MPIQTSVSEPMSSRSAKQSVASSSFWASVLYAYLQNSRTGRSGRNGTTLGILVVICQFFLAFWCFLGGWGVSFFVVLRFLN